MYRLIGLAIATTVTLGTISMTQAEALKRPEKACRFNDIQHQAWTPYEVKVTVRCLAKRMNVNVDTALYVADRESNFDRYAWNHYSDCRGVFQHMYRYWWSRVDAASKKLRKFAVHSRQWYSPRAQAVVTFFMVKRGGWGPWSL